MSMLYGTTDVITDQQGMFVMKRAYFGEETYTYFNENAISLNIGSYGPNFTRENTRTLNTLENDDIILVKARNFAIIQHQISEPKKKN
ncbi:MAG: alpha-amylase, partial [Nonlabens sp.]|nr:alpha-amylase [Nonlabens sp.]